MQKEQKEKLLIDLGYFTDFNSEYWTHADFQKLSNKFNWFSLDEAFAYEDRFNKEESK